MKRTDALPQKMAQNLLKRIIAEEFPPGVLLPSERELQDEYQVSRTVVREAIKLLASRKLVSTSWGQGAVVTADLTSPISDALMLAFYRSRMRTEDVFSVRLILEPHSAALAAQHATLSQVRRLRKMVEELAGISLDGTGAARSEAVERWGKLDADFHELLAESSQNPVIAMLVEVIVGILWRQQNKNDEVTTAQQYAISVEQHRAIAQAVADRDADSASRLMIVHLETTWENMSSVSEQLEVEVESLI